MEDNKKCLKYKEMIMAKVDGEADTSVLDIVSKHVKVCPGCANYEKTLENMVKLTSLMKVEAPEYLETRIMAEIKAQKPKINWFSMLSYGTTFSLALIAAFFLIYSKQSVPVQDMAKAKPVAVKHEAALKTSPVERLLAASQTRVLKIASSKTTENKIPIPEKAVKTVPEVAAIKVNPVYAETAHEMAANTSSEKGPVKENASVDKSPVRLASVPASAANPNYGVSLVEVNSGVRAAKVTPIPTQPGLTLLDTDKAIVANNLINPNKSEKARIVIKVEDTSLVKITIYDKTLRVVAKILNEEKSPGSYDAYWGGKNDSAQTVSTGTYLVYIQIGKRVVKKYIIVDKN